jgi:hypothetical protein
MALGIFEQLSWLTTRVKRLCCAVDNIKESGAGLYKVYTANITTYDGDGPQISNVVLENSLGDITISYFGIVDSWKAYSITSDALFTANTAIIFQSDFDTSSYTTITNISKIDSSTITLLVLTGFDITDKTLEIRVYN